LFTKGFPRKNFTINITENITERGAAARVKITPKRADERGHTLIKPIKKRADGFV
jgi:hypothetical protein